MQTILCKNTDELVPQQGWNCKLDKVDVRVCALYMHIGPHHVNTWSMSCTGTLHMCIPKYVHGTCDEAVSIMPVPNLEFKSNSEENTNYTCAHEHDLFHLKVSLLSQCMGTSFICVYSPNFRTLSFNSGRNSTTKLFTKLVLKFSVITK